MNQDTPRYRQSRLLKKSSKHSSAHAFEQYKQARLDGYSTVHALLELKFKTGIRDIAEFEKAIAEQLAREPSQIAPWHRTPLTQAACRDGMRLAALDFYWEHLDAIEVRLLAASFGDEFAAAYHAGAGRSDDYLTGRCDQIKARFDSIRHRYPDLAQALAEGLALLTFEGSHIQ